MINKNISKKEMYKSYKLFFGTLNSEQRLKILNLLKGREMNVSEIQEATGYEQSVVSHNLRRLKHCGFIKPEIKGKYRYYKIQEETIKPILNLIDKHVKKNCLMIIRRMKNNHG